MLGPLSTPADARRRRLLWWTFEPPLRAALCACSVALLGATSCGSGHSASDIGATGDASPGSGGVHSAGGAKGTGGASDGGSAGAGGDPSVCHLSNLSSAPLPCLQNFTRVTAKYPADCSTNGTYPSHCDPYDALVAQSATSVWCYYDSGTGNLIGARSTDDPNGKGGTCVEFDVSFVEPDVASCTHPSGGTCPAP